MISRLHGHRRHYIRYIFWCIVCFWLFVTGFVSYKYFLSTASSEVSKGGTFVEWIFWSTAFLPYIGNSQENYFYQGMLFDACMQFTSTEGQTTFSNNLCVVNTKDNQTYTVKLQDGHIWSDGTPVTIDDVYFTYNDIIKNNMWQLTNLTSYKDVVLEKTPNNTLKISFAKKSVDNSLFFAQFILPKHILANSDFAYYTDSFASDPVYTNCAAIKAQDTDDYSLVFDLKNCTDSNIWFYQIKNLESYEQFVSNTPSPSASIIDAYIWHGQLSGYITKDLISNNYVTLFFNTKSEKLGVRSRRALAGLIQWQFYSPLVIDYIAKDQWIFDKFASTGWDVWSFLQRIGWDSSLTIKDLEDSGVKQLSGNTIQFLEKVRKYSFYTDGKKDITLQAIINGDYDNLWLQINKKDIGKFKTFSKEKKEWRHKLSASSFASGANTIVIYTKNKENKNINIWSITYYVVDTSALSNTTSQSDNTITLVYQKNPISNFVVLQIKQIMLEAWVLWQFVFVWYDTSSELEGKLLTNEYDIALMNISKGLRKDISPILRSSEPQINPSQYTNPQFISLFDQYIQSTTSNSAVRNQLQWLYTRDVPFIILGKEIKKLQLRQYVYDKMQPYFSGKIYEHNWRDLIYKHLVLTSGVRIDIQKTGGTAGFINFVWSNVWNKIHNTTDQETGAVATGTLLEEGF